MSELNAEIKITNIPNYKALPVVNKAFRGLSTAVEMTMFSLAESLIKGYKGGLWELYKLSNGGVFWELPHDESKEDKVEAISPNGYKCNLTHKQAGVFIMLVTCSHISLEKNNFRAAENYHKVMDYVYALDDETQIKLYKLLD